MNVNTNINIKGIELSKAFYLEYGEPMLKKDFSFLLPFLAVGIAGSGSDCFGYDDGLSRDHDFEAGFCIFLPDETVVDRRSAFALERAYSKLPKEFMGVKRSELSPVGGNRRGVMRISDFFSERLGDGYSALTLKDWVMLSEQALAECVNGEIFFDGLGLISKIRKELSYMPNDVRLKKLAGELLIMGQSGQYNYERCLKRGDSGAAQLAIFEFVRSAQHVSFLLNEKYMPYYKWSFYAMKSLDSLSELSEPLEYLISSPNGEGEVEKKLSVLEDISKKIISELSLRGLSSYEGGELEGHAYSVNSKISDFELRSLHILFAV